MNAATAEMVLYAITAVAVLVWIEGLRFLTATVRKGKMETYKFSPQDEPAPANLIYGSAEVEGNASELSHRAVTLLATKSLLINERTDEKIVFQTPNEYLPDANTSKEMVPGLHRKEDPFAVQSQAGQWLSMHGQMMFTQTSPDKTRVEYAIISPRMRNTLILGFVIQALGLVAIIAGFLLIYFLVIPSNDPAVRVQTVQMIQVVHFLWPPYLFAAIAKKPAKIIHAQFDTFIHNLPFLKA